MFEPFSYPNSTHAQCASDPPAAQAPTAKPVASDPPADPLADAAAVIYRDKPKPKGAPADQVPPVVRDLREQDDARKMFSPQNDYRDSGLEDALAGVAEVADDVKAAAAAEYREIFADNGLNTTEARDVVSLARELVANPPDETTQQTWQADGWKDLVRTYGGEKGATEALELAKRLVMRDPRVAQLLDHTRLGNHPRIIKLMVEKARSERSRGRL